MKIFFVVLDGAADWKIKEFGKTPLQIASTPFLDKLAAEGRQSLIDVLPERMVPETDSGLMALLGYDPIEYYCGRGTLETIGLGLNGDYKYYAGFRINFASFNSRKGILDRRTSRDLSRDELASLTKEINDNISLLEFSDVSFSLVSFGTHRGILCFFSNTTELSGNVSNTDPCFEKKGYFSEPRHTYKMQVQKCVPLDDSAAADITAKILNRFTEQCYVIMSGSEINKKRVSEGKKPANCIIARDGGEKPKEMPSFYEKYEKTITIYGGLPCEKALAKLIKADFCYTKEMELLLDKFYLKKLSHKLLQNSSDIAFCHLKGPDESGHDHNPMGKIKAIEMIDKYFISEIVKRKQKNDIVIVTCDHMTPCELGIHSGDKVPLLISGGTFCADSLKHFDEYSAAKGNSDIKKATEVFNYVMRR